MSLKLFRSTEFAESALFSPSVQRIAIHPFWIAGLASAWLTTACNLVLWRELLRLPEMDSLQGLWFGLRLGIAIFAALCALLSLVSWRWSFKPVITALLVIAALGTHLMLTQGMSVDASLPSQLFQTRARTIHLLFNWSFLITLLTLAVLPAIWLWRTPVQRIPALSSLLQNALFFVTSCLLLAAISFLSMPDLSQLLQDQASLRQLINPFNTLYVLVDMIKR